MSSARDLYDHLLLTGQIEPFPVETPAIVHAEPRYQQDGNAAMWSLDGHLYREVPPPPLFHQHWAQTVFNLPLSDERWRCPCGAARDPFGAWYSQSWSVTGQRRWKGLWR